jgi:hypothetical protein
MPVTTTRTTVRQGIAAYFGGTYHAANRSWQNGPLLSSGLSTVRAGWGKKLNDNDFTYLQSSGRGMGAYMIVEIGYDKERRRSNAGPPVTSGGNIIAGGIKEIEYRVTLNVFHLAQKGFAEDAQADIDLLIEAVKQQIRVDRTLGGICTQAGESRFGIQTREALPAVDANNRTGTWFTVAFEVMTQILA